MTYLFTNNQEIKNDIGNPIPVSKNTTTNSSGNPIFVSAAISSITPVTGAADAFGRQRVSEPFTLGDYKHLYAIDPNFIDYTVNGGAITFQTNKACVRLSTTTNTTSRAVHQTKVYHHYMPGKSQMILSSINFYNPVAGVTKRTGYFDDRNGIFFEQAGDGTLAMVIRSYVTGTAVDTKISQNGGVYGAGDTGWNGDKINGTGPSGWTMANNMTQLWWCDFQWLGVGRVRVGFVHNNEFITCHTFYHSDNLPTVYMSNPDLPVRCEILNTGTTAGGYFDQICSTVLSEGGYMESGTDWAVGNGGTFRSLAVGATMPVVAIRLKNAFNGDVNRILVRLQNMSVFSATENVYFQLAKLPNQASLTGSTWVSIDDQSGVEYSVTSALAVGASPDTLITGYVTAGTSNGSSTNTQISNPSQAKKNYIVQNYGSTDSEIYAILVTNTSNQATNIAATIQWREIF